MPYEVSSSNQDAEVQGYFFGFPILALGFTAPQPPTTGSTTGPKADPGTGIVTGTRTHG